VVLLENPRPVTVTFVPADPDDGVRVREGMTVKVGQATLRL
jgi:hypothetical protein